MNRPLPLKIHCVVALLLFCIVLPSHGGRYSGRIETGRVVGTLKGRKGNSQLKVLWIGQNDLGWFRCNTIIEVPFGKKPRSRSRQYHSYKFRDPNLRDNPLVNRDGSLVSSVIAFGGYTTRHFKNGFATRFGTVRFKKRIKWLKGKRQRLRGDAVIRLSGV